MNARFAAIALGSVLAMIGFAQFAHADHFHPGWSGGYNNYQGSYSASPYNFGGHHHGGQHSGYYQPAPPRSGCNSSYNNYPGYGGLNHGHSGYGSYQNGSYFNSPYRYRGTGFSVQFPSSGFSYWDH